MTRTRDAAQEVRVKRDNRLQHAVNYLSSKGVVGAWMASSVADLKEFSRSYKPSLSDMHSACMSLTHILLFIDEHDKELHICVASIGLALTDKLKGERPKKELVARSGIILDPTDGNIEYLLNSTIDFVAECLENGTGGVELSIKNTEAVLKDLLKAHRPDIIGLARMEEPEDRGISIDQITERLAVELLEALVKEKQMQLGLRMHARV